MSSKTVTVGIDALAFSGPECYLEMADLAEARGVEPLKFTAGLGQHKMSVATPCEDTVTMAVKAGRAALERFNIDPNEIGTLIVGTETGIDHSKPVSVYVHELLGLPSNCRAFEIKHACYGGMAGITTSADWISSGRARGRKALVIASDIARYGIGTPGEPTQGAGAVAIVISESPRLVELHMNCIGDYTRQVMDFWRPLYSKYAYTDGHFSIACYLNALEGAIDDARRQANDPNALSLEHLDACFYHVPFVKMAKKAHRRHVEMYTDEADVFDASYAHKVAPWLSLNAEVGNIYTGALFLALIDYLSQLEPGREGERVSLFSYGSGSGAAFCAGRIVPGASALAPALDPRRELDNRRRLGIEEYEVLLRGSEHADHNDYPSPVPTDYQHTGDLYYLGTEDHIRRYGAAAAGQLKRTG